MTIALGLVEPERCSERIDADRGTFVTFALFRFTRFSARNKRMAPCQTLRAHNGGYGVSEAPVGPGDQKPGGLCPQFRHIGSRRDRRFRDRFSDADGYGIRYRFDAGFIYLSRYMFELYLDEGDFDIRDELDFIGPPGQLETEMAAFFDGLNKLK